MDTKVEKKEAKTNISLNDLSDAELKKLERDLMRKKAKEEKEKEKRIVEYKDNVSAQVEKMFVKLERASERITDIKNETHKEFSSIIKEKKNIFGSKIQKQFSNTFANKKVDKRITLGYSIRDNWDDTVNDGIEKVQDAVRGFVNNKETKILVDAILKLLSKDAKGNLKASRILHLEKLANESKSKKLMEGVGIIKNAYLPIKSKQYIKVEKKNDLGKWIQVPLSILEC